MGWWQGAGRQTTITRVRSQSEQIRDETLQRAHALLASGKDPAKALEFLAHNLTNKLLHAPSASLRQAALSGDTDLLRAAERLFRSEEHTSELQSLMRISYAVLCLKKTNTYTLFYDISRYLL